MSWQIGGWKVFARNRKFFHQSRWNQRARSLNRSGGLSKTSNSKVCCTFLLIIVITLKARFVLKMCLCGPFLNTVKDAISLPQMKVSIWLQLNNSKIPLQQFSSICRRIPIYESWTNIDISKSELEDLKWKGNCLHFMVFQGHVRDKSIACKVLVVGRK